MPGLTLENTVSLGRGDARIASHLGDATVVVAQVGVERRERPVRRERHRGEEPHTVGLSLGAEAHHAFEQPVGSLARREIRDVWRTGRVGPPNRPDWCSA